MSLRTSLTRAGLAAGLAAAIVAMPATAQAPKQLKCSLKAPTSMKMSAFLKSGLTATMTCDGASTINGNVTILIPLAKKLHMANGAIGIASAKPVSAKAGQAAKIHLSPTAKAKKNMRNARNVAATLSVYAQSTGKVYAYGGKSQKLTLK